MIGWIFVILGQSIFWGSFYMAEKYPKEEDWWMPFGNIGFWLTFLGGAILIWG